MSAGILVSKIKKILFSSVDLAMAIPKKIEPVSLDDYLEVMTKEIFQAGLSWAAIDKKWSGFRKAFNDFDVEKVSLFGEAKIQKLITDKEIVRSESKIRGTVHNAKRLLELDKQFGGIVHYLRSFKTYEELSRSLQNEFAYLGELSVYYFLFRLNEKVPPFKQWEKTIDGDHPRMREMVALSKRKSSPDELGDAINQCRQ